MAVPTGSSSKNSSATGGTVDTAMHESSVTSDGGVADWESLANRKKKPRRKRKVLIKSISGQRYWNELEGDGDDNDPEPFTILIASDRKLDEDDDEDLSLSAYIVGSVNRALHALGSTFRVQRTDLGTNERTSLLDHDPHNLDGDSSSDEESRFPSGRGGYGTQTSGVRRRRRRIARHVLFLFAAFFSLAFAAAIALEDSLSGRKRKRRDPAEHLLLDFGVLAFLLGSLGFAVLGLAMFLMHHRTMTWIHSCLVWTAFVIIMAGNGAVAALQGRTQIEN